VGRHGKWDGDLDYRPASRGTVDSHRAAQRVNAVFEPDDPEPLRESAPPIPSSRIDRYSLSSTVTARTMTSEAWACLATLASASAVTLVGGDLDGFA
jgi:hypothetical protein